MTTPESDARKAKLKLSTIDRACSRYVRQSDKTPRVCNQVLKDLMHKHSPDAATLQEMTPEQQDAFYEEVIAL